MIICIRGLEMNIMSLLSKIAHFVAKIASLLHCGWHHCFSEGDEIGDLAGQTGWGWTIATVITFFINNNHNQALVEQQKHARRSRTVAGEKEGGGC